MYLEVTALYAGILAVISILLSFQVGGQRMKTGISILHGNDMELAQAIRRHANFTEAVPIALILLAVIEANGASLVLMHSLGAALVVARIVHPLGLFHDRMRHPLRFAGAMGTTIVTLIAAFYAIWQFASA